MFVELIRSLANLEMTECSVYFFCCNELYLVFDLSQPLWVLKTAKEKYVQRLVHMSADLARQVGMMLEESQNGSADEVSFYTFL